MKYQNLYKEEKEKKQKYGCDCFKNLLEDQKQKIVDYRKKYYRMRKFFYYNYFFKYRLKFTPEKNSKNYEKIKTIHQNGYKN